MCADAGDALVSVIFSSKKTSPPAVGVNSVMFPSNISELRSALENVTDRFILACPTILVAYITLAKFKVTAPTEAELLSTTIVS